MLNVVLGVYYKRFIYRPLIYPGLFVGYTDFREFFSPFFEFKRFDARVKLNSEYIIAEFRSGEKIETEHSSKPGLNVTGSWAPPYVENTEDARTGIDGVILYETKRKKKKK